MIWTVGDILKVISRYSDAGTSGECLEGEALEKALEFYNSINDELMDLGDWKHLKMEVCFPVYDCCFSLPYRFADIVRYQVNGVSIDNEYFSQGYKYTENGNWGVDCCDCSGLEDMGDHWGTERDLQKPMHIMAFSDRPESDDAKIRIYGMQGSGMQATTQGEDGASPGHVLPIRYGLKMEGGGRPAFTAGDAWSDGKFIHVERLRKCVTNGYVKVLGYDPETKEVMELATLSPGDQSPNYRRLRLAQPCRNTSIRALVITRPVPLHHPNEISLLQKKSAYETYAQALQFRREGKANEYLAFRNMAVKSLKDQKWRETKHKKFNLPVDVDSMPLRGRSYGTLGGPTRVNYGRRWR